MKRILIVLLLAILAAAGYPTGVNAADDVPPILSPIDTTGLKHAVRGEQIQLAPPPPPPVLWTTESANGRCVGMIPAIQHWNPGWNVDRMAGIAYRESRCDPNAANSCCTGIFQIHATWIDNVAMCGVSSRADLKDPWKNVCAASVVFREQGMGAWSTA